MCGVGQVQQVMDMWPRDAAAAQRAQLAHPDGSVVSCADGAAAALSSPAALNLVDQWQVKQCNTSKRILRIVAWRLSRVLHRRRRCGAVIADSPGAGGTAAGGLNKECSTFGAL